MYETYLQNERETREKFQQFADGILWSNDDGSEKYIGIGNMADWWIETDRLSLIKVMKALEKELEGEIRQKPYKYTVDDEEITDNNLVTTGFNSALSLSLDKIREFIKLLEKGV